MVLSSLETIWFLENPWPWSKDMEKGLKWSENTLQACLKWITKSPFDSFLLTHMFKNCNFKIFDNSVFFLIHGDCRSSQFFYPVNCSKCTENHIKVIKSRSSWERQIPELNWGSRSRLFVVTGLNPGRRERRRPAEACPDSSITFHWLKLYNDLIERLKRSFEFSEFSKQF